MSQLYQEELYNKCAEALDLAFDLMEAYTSTFAEKDLQNASDALKIAIDSNNLEDAYALYLPTLELKILHYTNELADLSRENFYGIGDLV